MLCIKQAVAHTKLSVLTYHVSGELKGRYPHDVPFNMFGLPDFSRYSVKNVNIGKPVSDYKDFKKANILAFGKNNPFGILIAGIFYAALDVGGSTLQLRYQVDKEIVSIIQALIIIFVASENLFKIFVSKRKGK